MNSRLCAIGLGLAVSTLTSRTARLRSWPSTSRSAGTSNTSCRHSRDASSRIGNVGYLAATASRSAARWRCCHSGVRWSGRRRGSSSARPAHSRKRDENSAVCGSVATTSSSMSSGSMSNASRGSSSACLGEPQDDAVVAPHRLDRQVVAIGQPPLDRHRPRRVHRRAERAEHADPPVADLVAEALDDDGAVVGHDAGGLGLLVEVLQQVRRGERVERVVARAAARWPAPVVELAQLADERAERPAELERAARPVAVPERHLARLARRRRDGDPLERDVLDPPRRRAEHERLAGPALVDHLLVELADPRAVGQEHAEQAAVGDRAAGRDGEALGPVARPHGVGDPVPHDPGPQLGELLARVATGEQVERVAELLVGQLGEVGAAAHQRGELGDGRLAAGRDVGDDLLGEHVERVAQVAGATRSAPSSMRRATTAASSRSPRCFG